MQQILLQYVTAILLQNATVLLQNGTAIAKCDDFIGKSDSYYKMRRLLQIATVQLLMINQTQIMKLGMKLSIIQKH